MATIKKLKLPPFWFSGSEGWLQHNVCTLNHTLNVTDNLLEYKLTRTKLDEETEDLIIYDFKVTLDTLKNNKRLSDQSYWAFNCSKYVGQQEELSNEQLLSIFDLSYPAKRKIVVLPADTDYLSSIRMFVPSVNSKFTDCLFQVLQPEDIVTPGALEPSSWNVTVNTTVNSPNTFVNEDVKISNVIATITSSTSVSSPVAGDVIPVTVTCSDTSVTKVYVEQIVGTADRTEVDLTNGSGSFNILTNTLSSGDTVRMKIGHKKYSNINTFTKTLA